MRIQGTGKSEVIYGTAGDDSINGGGGNDTIISGAGTDWLDRSDPRPVVAGAGDFGNLFPFLDAAHPRSIGRELPQQLHQKSRAAL